MNIVPDHRELPPPRAGRPALLCISQAFAPRTLPTAIRATKLVEHLLADWDVTVITESEGAAAATPARAEIVAGRRPQRLLAGLRRVHLDKLLELLVWPDESIFWVLPAILAGRRVIRETRPSAIVVFMMPYSSGLAGVVLSRLTGVPLVLNLDDSPTCTDMHPRFPTRLHHRLARALEDLYAREADAVVYVSARNLETVRDRQRASTREKFHLVRYGADRRERAHDSPATASSAAARERFEIVYVGAMSGWWALIGEGETASPLRRLYAAWSRLGSYELIGLDPRTSSPAVIGRAILGAIAEHRDWAGRVHLTAYGNPYEPSVIARALSAAGIEEVTTVLDPVPHELIGAIVDDADLLFITLPMRIDGSPGGRISAKTYEYLATDRPILAAVPRGENWDYLAGKPGVWLLEPDDAPGMQAVIGELAAEKFAGRPVAFAREALREQLSYAARAAEFADVIRAAIARRRASRS